MNGERNDPEYAVLDYQYNQYDSQFLQVQYGMPSTQQNSHTWVDVRNRSGITRRRMFKAVGELQKAGFLEYSKDESLEDIDRLPEPEVIAVDIIENLESFLDQFRSMQEGLSND